MGEEGGDGIEEADVGGEREKNEVEGRGAGEKGEGFK